MTGLWRSKTERRRVWGVGWVTKFGVYMVKLCRMVYAPIPQYHLLCYNRNVYIPILDPHLPSHTKSSLFAIGSLVA
jgi:hypothetical protein